MQSIGTNGLSRLILGGLLAIPVAGLSSQESRIIGPVEGSSVVILKGNIHPKALPADDRGALDPFTPIPYIRMSLKPATAQQADLEQFLEAQRDPASSDYHRWLTPEEFGDRFGVGPGDLEKVTAWLQSEGFTIDRTARARNWIAFSGTAGQVGKTFRTELRRYQSDSEMHFANSTEPSIPRALAGIVSELHGLNDFRLKPPRMKNIAPTYTASNGAHYLAPDDLAAIYDISPLYKAGYDGSGQKLAIVGQTDINLADIRGFRAEFGLTAKDPQLVLYGPDPGVSSNDEIESDLDLEWSGAVARNATIVFVYSTDVLESMSYAVDENLAPVISMSYGECELGVSPSNRALAQQANAEGITWMSSSGDSGAAGCDWGGPSAAEYGPAVTFPADIPEITAVGGTEFNESGSAGWSSQNSPTFGSATGYLPEKAWNDTALGGGIWASGGGASAVFPKPWWQTGPGVPSDNARDVPDVSLTASGDHDGYLIYFSGQVYTVGGTSASSPSFAGLVAIVNQYVTATGSQSKPGLGNINPTLYSLAQNTTGIIHDITSGDNIVPCVSKSTGCTTGSFGYKAGVGYDQVTGIGSVDAYNLVTKWSSLPTNVGTTTTLTASPASIAQSASTQLSAKVAAVTGSNPPTGSVNFALGNVSLGSAALTASGTSATAALTVKGTSLTGGSDTITATYAATGSFNNSTGSVTVTVTGTPVATKTVVAAGSASVASSGTDQLTATVSAASGSVAPTGTVTFLAGTTSLGTATLAAGSTSGVGTAALSVSASKLAAGANSITASFAGSASFGGSVSTAVTVTVSAPAIATTATLAANPSSIAQSASTVLTITVKAASGTTSPTGTVTFTAGSAALGGAALAGSGGTATATLSVSGSKLAVGANSITASYAGSASFGGSVSTAVTVTVTSPLLTTTATLAANPPSIAQSASTVLTVTVKAASGTTSPTGTVTFAAGSAALGGAALAGSAGTATATLSVKGTSLAAGSNSISATYSGDSKFSGSTASVTVTLTVSAVATTTVVTANPTTIAQNAATTIAATVRAATGASLPTGTVTFTLGSASLGSAPLTASGSTASAALSLPGSKLSVGNNTITASYGAAGGFASSVGTVVVVVTAPQAATTTTLTASPASIGQTATTQLTAAVKAASGSVAPTGSVTFAAGNVSLGSASLVASGSSATATLTVKASSLAAGSNAIKASYSGSSAFAPSTGLATITVASVASNVVVTATKTTDSQPGFAVKVQLQDTSAGATTLTGFTLNGTSFTPAIASFFGGTQIAANATLTSTLNVQWSPLPATLVFVFNGVDPSGRQWSQTVSLATK